MDIGHYILHKLFVQYPVRNKFIIRITLLISAGAPSCPSLLSKKNKSPQQTTLRLSSNTAGFGNW